MAIVLGSGDAFHLVPRMWAMWTTGMEANAAALGVGKLITSLTMTVFYIILYYIWRERYAIEGRKGLTVSLWGLLVARVALCLFYRKTNGCRFIRRCCLAFCAIFRLPSWGLSLLLVYLRRKQKRRTIRSSQNVASRTPLVRVLYPCRAFQRCGTTAIGMLMIPKTLAYVWIVWMGWKLYRQSVQKETL